MRLTLRSLYRKSPKWVRTAIISIRRNVSAKYFTHFSQLLRFLRNLAEFRRFGGRVTNFYPILDDFKDGAGTASGHYFHQDLFVASLIAANNPRRHIDVGSRIDGFVAHVASFREIEILDVRSLGEIGHPQITFIQRDLMVAEPGSGEITDSLSCLHTIEHFGLGRYGDRIDPHGHLKGFQNLVDMLEPGGLLYISFPIGNRDSVYFNAHRVFHPTSILKWPLRDGPLELKQFSFVDDSGDFHRNVPLDASLPELLYGCGIYTFCKS